MGQATSSIPSAGMVLCKALAFRLVAKPWHEVPVEFDGCRWKADFAHCKIDVLTYCCQT